MFFSCVDFWCDVVDDFFWVVLELLIVLDGIDWFDCCVVLIGFGFCGGVVFVLEMG